MHGSPALTTFGKYQIIGRIAVGGMAEIYKARLNGIGGFQRLYAIKRILPHLSSQPEFVDMLVDEARIAGLLSHANIVHTVDFGKIDDAYYIAMEYVDGADLGRVMRRCREKEITIPVPHAVFICVEMLKGLEYAHTRQVMRGNQPVSLDIVHRDMSPANVLVGFQGEVKLTDFGIAKASVKALETISGIVKGRFDYLSPEQAAGRPADQRSDLFATGVVLAEMLTGRHPFTRAREADTLTAVRDGRFEPLHTVNPDVPSTLSALVARSLTPDPDNRFQSATEMKEALHGFFLDAGFMLSHAALGSFVRELFPREDDDAPQRPTPPQRAIAPDEIDLLDDLPDLPDGGISDFSEAATVVRDLEELELDEPAAFGDAHTMIRPDPTAEPPGVTSPRVEPAIARAEPTPPRLHKPRAEQTPPRPTPAPPTADTARPPSPMRLLAVVVGTLVFTGTNVLSFAIGMRMTPSLDAASAPPGPGRPELHLQLPDGAHLTVDGREILAATDRTALTLSPGTPHVIRIELDGYQPFESRLVLAPGDVRVLFVSADQLTEATP